MNEIDIQNRKIGSQHKPFIIAEMSGNHNQSLERALEIVDQVAEAGADAIKLQTYTADTMTLKSSKPDFMINEETSLWFGKDLYALYQQAHTPWEWHEPIFERAKKKGLIAFSSAFDETAVDFLESLNVPAYKIASFENIDIPLISKIAKTGKPIIISTGLASLAEIDEAVQCARKHGCEQLVLLKCTSSYPASPAQSNLKTIPHLAQMMHCPVGLSDHTLGMGAAVASVALGACVIEKHVTLSRSEGGVDAAFSMEPSELAIMVEECNHAWQAIGDVFYGRTESEEQSLCFRRSIYFSANAKAGEKLSEANVRVIRPGHGLAPKYLEKLMGKTLKNDVESGTPLTWDCIE